MSAAQIEAALDRVARRRADLAEPAAHAAAVLGADEGVEAVHQAALQEYLWWRLPRRSPIEDWRALAQATAELLDELGPSRLATSARSPQTASVISAWRRGPDHGERPWLRRSAPLAWSHPTPAGWRGAR